MRSSERYKVFHPCVRARLELPKREVTKHYCRHVAALSIAGGYWRTAEEVLANSLPVEIFRGSRNHISATTHSPYDSVWSSSCNGSPAQ
jgi:hypothetical protein